MRILLALLLAACAPKGPPPEAASAPPAPAPPEAESPYHLAPPLDDVETWVSGGPVVLGAEGVTIVELWATWCGPCIEQMPHLAALQQAHAGAVTVAAISDEDAATVGRFIEQRGGSLGYAVGADPDGSTTRRYHSLFGSAGIPRSFIVEGGQVLWSGHPGHLDPVLSAVLAGRWTADHARYASELPGMMARYLDSARVGQRRQAAALGEHILRYADYSPGMLNDFAWMILTEIPADRRDVPLALLASEKAVGMENEPAYLDTYALALFESGRVSEAIDRQREAVAGCPVDDAACGEMKARLAQFEASRP